MLVAQVGIWQGAPLEPPEDGDVVSQVPRIPAAHRHCWNRNLESEILQMGPAYLGSSDWLKTQRLLGWTGPRHRLCGGDRC